MATATAKPPKKNLLEQEVKKEPAPFKGRVLSDHVLIRTKSADVETPGGIILPDIAQQRQQPNSGTVLAVGPGTPLTGDAMTEYRPVAVKVGERVVFSAYAGTKVQIGDEELLVLGEKEILLVL